MAFYDLEILGLKRKLPIVAISPKIKIASLNLLGDSELVTTLSKGIAKKLEGIDFDYLVGPEVKIVPVLQELSKLLGQKKYIVLRKNIHGYMINPLRADGKNSLVINGSDAKLAKNKKIVIIDDVVSSGSTLYMVEKLMDKANAQVVAKIAIFKQGDRLHPKQNDLMYLDILPVFKS